MRLIVIEAAKLSYTVYEDRRMVVAYQAAELLLAHEIEEIRADAPPDAPPDAPGFLS